MRLANAALDSFGFVILLIIFFSCLAERIKKETKNVAFLLLLGAIMVALAADAVFWISNGYESFGYITLIAHTVADCFGYITVVLIPVCLYKNLVNSRVMKVLLILFSVGSVLYIAVSVLNIFYGYSYFVDSDGICVRGEYPWVAFVFQFVGFVITLLALLIMPGISTKKRLFAMTYPLFPIIGIIIDYNFDFMSTTYVGLVVCVLIMYTNIYLQKREIINEQRTALMISQINPHFMYNTLTTIASLCEIEPKEAKALTIEFSTFLRQNLNTLTTSQLIPFEQELKHVGCYLKIEKARFKERVNVAYAIHCKDFVLPALTIQPLVENAVRYGITKKAEGGTVKITTYKTEKDYVIEIKDDGVGFDVDAKPNDGKTHVGLENVRSRLHSMSNGTLSVKSMIGVGTRVIVTIPIKKGKMTQ